MIRAGTPTARELAGMLFVTTEPAPMTTLSPMVTPGRIVRLWLPVKSLPMWMFFPRHHLRIVEAVGQSRIAFLLLRHLLPVF